MTEPGSKRGVRRRRNFPFRAVLVTLGAVYVCMLQLNFYLLAEDVANTRTPFAIGSIVFGTHGRQLRTDVVPPPLPCALLFFGAPRMFQSVVLPSVKKYILKWNPTCDVFLHTYNVTSISTARSQEKNQAMDPTEVYQLTSNVVMDTMDDFYSQHNLTYYREHHHEDHGWGKCCDSTDNVIKQWHSIEAVWKLMEAHEATILQQGMDTNPRTKDRYYERVGLFRSDAFYTNPISIMDPMDTAVVPNWAFKNRKTVGVEEVVNDRLFYGSYANAKVWATERFKYAPHYFDRYQDYDEGRKQGLHSETFLYTLLTKQWDMALTKRPICFWRTRASGMIMSIDCRVPSHDGREGTIEDPEDWEILKDSTCCWNCQAVAYKEEDWGACTPEAQQRLQNKHTFLE